MIALPCTERHDGHVQSRQRRGAGIVDGHARSSEIEDVRQTAGQRRGDAGHCLVIRERHTRTKNLIPVLVKRDTEVDAGPSSTQQIRTPGVLKSAVHDLKQNAKLRVEPQCLPGSYAEEGCVEPVRLDEASPARARTVGSPGFGAVPRAPVPAPFRDLRDQVIACTDMLPVCPKVRRTGESSVHADDCYLPADGVQGDRRSRARHGGGSL